jgi:hypothetical protein
MSFFSAFSSAISTPTSNLPKKPSSICLARYPSKSEVAARLTLLPARRWRPSRLRPCAFPVPAVRVPVTRYIVLLALLAACVARALAPPEIAALRPGLLPELGLCLHLDRGAGGSYRRHHRCDCVRRRWRASGRRRLEERCCPHTRDARTLSYAGPCLSGHDRNRTWVDRVCDFGVSHSRRANEPSRPGILRTGHDARMSSLAWIDFDEAELQRAQRIMALYRGHRIRAVDSDGRLIETL